MALVFVSREAGSCAVAHNAKEQVIVTMQCTTSHIIYIINTCADALMTDHQRLAARTHCLDAGQQIVQNMLVQ